MCRFPSLGLAGVVCAHAHTDGGPWSTRREVRGLVAAPQRAPAAPGVGGRGAAAGAWWRARGRAGRWRQRDDRPQGRRELEAGEAPFPPGRVRRPGGGRKQAARQDPDLVPALLALVEPDERGDPESPLRWTTKSLRHLAEELTRQGTRSPPRRWADCYSGKGSASQANVKTLEGAQHPDRDAQFRYLNEQVKDHQADGEPVISVDTNKREQLGRLPMAGREWRPKGEPVEVEDHHLLLHRSGRPGRPSRTGSTTSPATPAGSMSASTTTPASSRSSPSAAGGRYADAGTTRRHRAC
jgi:hypothetical protein